jgi:hypothetical protein
MLIPEEGAVDCGEYRQAAVGVAAVTLPSRAIPRRATRGYQGASQRQHNANRPQALERGSLQCELACGLDRYPQDGGQFYISSHSMMPRMARRRHESMSDMSPLLGAKQT